MGEKLQSGSVAPREVKVCQAESGCTRNVNKSRAVLKESSELNWSPVIARALLEQISVLRHQYTASSLAQRNGRRQTLEKWPHSSSI